MQQGNGLAVVFRAGSKEGDGAKEKVVVMHDELKKATPIGVAFQLVAFVWI